MLGGKGRMRVWEEKKGERPITLFRHTIFSTILATVTLMSFLPDQFFIMNYKIVPETS